jgi:putative transposase
MPAQSCDAPIERFADAYFGRAPAIIKQCEWIKRQTIEYRSLQHRKLAA